MRPLSCWRACAAWLAPLSVFPLAACSSGSSPPDPDPASSPDVPFRAPPRAPASAVCDALGLPSLPFADGPHGMLRGEIAGDFSIELMSGEVWSLRKRWSGCESYIFVPDTLRRSGLDDTSVWARDVDKLIEGSPRNAHYFFVSRVSSAEAAVAADEMQHRIAEALSALPSEDADHWRARLHVSRLRAADLGNWVQDALAGHGRGGLAIDRLQRVRGVGYLADVNRYKSSLSNAGQWPWESNLAYAAHEARYFNHDAERQARLDTDGAAVVSLWSGEVLEEFAEVDVALPPAAEMAAFDTLEIEVVLACPDPEKVELNNCGAWDYLASLKVQAGGGDVEVARFITSYHRETRWVVDASPMLAHLRDGGMKHFRWDFAPPWNTQPTATRLSLRLSSRAKGYAPSEVTPLWSGGAFDASYNVDRLPIEAPIPADAARVEVWALITGHGADTASCAEFCDHQHEIAVGGATYLKEHPLAATNTGCIGEIENGMIPNQGGTWWFGRGGWCPGQQVEPWVIDVTGDVTPGETATFSYRGLLGGNTPPSNAGNIEMSSYLVIYR